MQHARPSRGALGPALMHLVCLVIGHSRDLVFERGEVFGSYHWRCARCLRISDDVVLTPTPRYRERQSWR